MSRSKPPDEDKNKYVNIYVDVHTCTHASLDEWVSERGNRVRAGLKEAVHVKHELDALHVHIYAHVRYALCDLEIKILGKSRDYSLYSGKSPRLTFDKVLPFKSH